MYKPLVLVVAALAAGAGVAGQQEQGPIAQFSGGVQLVEVYATVTDAKRELVTGLREEDFDVYEDNQRQHVSAFAAGEFPLTVALGIDRSWSMAGDQLQLAKQASRAFLRALKPSDRSMVVAISNQADVIAAPDLDRFSQDRAIAKLDPWSTTALHDAIIATLDRLEPEPGRQALVVFSDGIDRYSRASAADVVERARRSNALIYPIAFGKVRPPLLAGPWSIVSCTRSIPACSCAQSPHHHAVSVSTMQSLVLKEPPKVTESCPVSASTIPHGMSCSLQPRS